MIATCQQLNKLFLSQQIPATARQEQTIVRLQV